MDKIERVEKEIELGELHDIIGMIENPLFQKHIVKPLRDAEDELTTAFFSDSLKDSWRKGGKREGIELFFQVLKNIHIAARSTKSDLENS